MVVFDDWIAQELVAGVVDLAADRFGISLDVNFQVLADVNGLNSLVTHVFQGLLNGLALWVNDRSFRRNGDLRFHRFINLARLGQTGF
jgi:hypothetical protein